MPVTDLDGVTLTLTVPMPPTMMNRRSSNHWRAVHCAKLDYWERLDNLRLASKCVQPDSLACLAPFHVPEPPPEPLARVAVYSVMHLGGAMDDDNAMHRHKFLLDWLKSREYIVDDRRKNLKWVSFPEQHVKRDGNYRITISLSRIEE